MSVQPLNSFRQADDFYNVYLHTSKSINNSKTNPRWIMPVSGLMGDRYKFFKKCIAVVNYLSMPNQVGLLAGSTYVIRDVSNSQMNSTDSITTQSNNIFFFQAAGQVFTDSSPDTTLDGIDVTVSADLKAQLQVGMPVSGPGIQSDSFVASISLLSDRFQLNKRATATQANVTLTFGTIGEGNNRTNVQNVGFPYLKVNPFGEQEFSLTLPDESTPITSPIGEDWGIHITYYFYYE